MHGCSCRGYAWAFAVSVCAMLVIACVPAVPADLLAAIEAIDQELIALRAPEAASDEYAHFVRQWVSLKARVESDDDVIRWPWESSGIEEQLRRLQDEGGTTIARILAIGQGTAAVAGQAAPSRAARRTSASRIALQTQTIMAIAFIDNAKRSQ